MQQRLEAIQKENRLKMGILWEMKMAAISELSEEDLIAVNVIIAAAGCDPKIVQAMRD